MSNLDPKRSSVFTAGVLATLAIAWAIAMQITFAYTYKLPHRFNHEIDSPILALELSRNASDVKAVTQNNLEASNALRQNTILDCVFIPLYAGYVLFFGLTFAPGRKKLFIPLAAAIALCDYAENILMLQSLRGGPVYQYFPSVCKWALLGLALLFIARYLAAASDGTYSLPTRQLLAILFAVAGILILLGLSLGPYSWLQLGTSLFACTVLINAIGLFGPVFAWPVKPPPAYAEDPCKAETVL